MQLKSLVKFALPVLMAFSATAPAQVAEPSAKLAPASFPASRSAKRSSIWWRPANDSLAFGKLS